MTVEDTDKSARKLYSTLESIESPVKLVRDFPSKSISMSINKNPLDYESENIPMGSI
jgi:hypothetical protein